MTAAKPAAAARAAMMTHTERLAGVIGAALAQAALGEPFGFDLRWDITPGPAGPALVWQAVFTLPSPLLGAPTLVAPVQITRPDLTPAQAAEMVGKVCGLLRNTARAQLARPPRDGEEG